MRTLAIGDIHGCLTALETLADHVAFTESDTIVALGDYVDRGPDSKGVIDYLLALRERTNLVTLRGNHEIMMLGARDDRPSRHSWLNVGGDATMESYGAETFDAIPAEHWEFLENLKPYYETETHIFVHANLDPSLPLEDQHEADLCWEFFDHPSPHCSGKTMICGHSSQKTGHPKNIGHAICIDTFAHGGGWLTCLDTESGRYWQTNEQGETRTDVISVHLVEVEVHE